MHHYRQVLARLRQGDSDRDVVRSRLMGRPKVAAFRALVVLGVVLFTVLRKRR